MQDLVRRDDVDGLRAIAVLAILAFHLELAGFTGGFVGVDIFFVISGYVILRGILPDLQRGSFSLVDFYVRRARRLLPALTVVLTATLIAGAVILSPAELTKLAHSALATMVFGANFYFHDQAGYFASAAHTQPLLHTWSLSVEEQFYIVVPLTLAVLVRRGAAAAAIVLFGLAVASFGYSLIASGISEKHAFFMPLARFWEFAIGGCVAFAEHRWGLVRTGSGAIAVFGMVAIGATVFILDGGSGGQQWVLVSVLGTAAIIAAGGSVHNPVAAMLASRPLVAIGRLSYSIYLVHWPLIVFWRLCVARPLVPHEQVLIVIVAVALAAAIWSLIETPLRAGASQFANKPVLGGIAASSVTMAAMAAALIFDRGGEWRMNPLAMEAIASLRVAVAERPPCTPDHSWMEGAFPACRWNSDVQATDYVIWGDSHMAMLAPELATALGRDGARGGVSIAMPDCPPLASVTIAGRKNQKRCHTFVDAAIRAIERHRPKLVVIAARWARLDSGLPAPGTGERSRAIMDLTTHTPLTLTDALVRSIKKVSASGAHVIVVGPVPEIDYDVPATLVRSLMGFGRMPPVSRRDFDNRQERVLRALGQIQTIENVTVVYPHTALCNADTCAVADGIRSLYMDDDHLSPFGSARVVAMIHSVADPKDTALTKSVREARGLTP
jgi:peptidoglycan/LPS O-acetylase OafA/YrhL